MAGKLPCKPGDHTGSVLVPAPQQHLHHNWEELNVCDFEYEPNAMLGRASATKPYLTAQFSETQESKTTYCDIIMLG